MKKLYYAFTVLLFTFLGTTNLIAQTNCASISALAFSNQQNYYGVRVSVDQTYDDDITVSGHIQYEEG